MTKQMHHVAQTIYDLTPGHKFTAESLKKLLGFSKSSIHHGIRFATLKGLCKKFSKGQHGAITFERLDFLQQMEDPQVELALNPAHLDLLTNKQEPPHVAPRKRRKRAHRRSNMVKLRDLAEQVLALAVEIEQVALASFTTEELMGELSRRTKR